MKYITIRLNQKEAGIALRLMQNVAESSEDPGVTQVGSRVAKRIENAMLDSAQAQEDAPLATVEERYRDLLNRLGMNGHDGAVNEIESLRAKAGLEVVSQEPDSVSDKPDCASPEAAEPRYAHYFVGYSADRMGYCVYGRLDHTSGEYISGPFPGGEAEAMFEAESLNAMKPRIIPDDFQRNPDGSECQR